jgi:16S rRNA C1402 N4-methylase RsmH
MPNIPEEFRPAFRVVGKAIKADATETAMNRRARSARLRIAERT